MKSEKEIKEEIKGFKEVIWKSDKEHPESTAEYWKGFEDALKWVLED